MIPAGPHTPATQAAADRGANAMPDKHQVIASAIRQEIVTWTVGRTNQFVARGMVLLADTAYDLGLDIVAEAIQVIDNDWNEGVLSNQDARARLAYLARDITTD